MIASRYLCLASLVLLACSAPPPVAQGTQDPTRTSQPVPQAQVLPITAQVVIGRETIGLEVARSPQEQALGLMYRLDLPEDRGMLFLFEPAQQVSFWMKNVELDLDMIFLQNGTVVAIEAAVPPCRREPCPLYGPGERVDQVIELRGGRAAELGLQVGDRLTLEFLE